MRLLRTIWTNIEFFVFFPRCPWCHERTSHIEAHFRTQHAGDR